MSELSKLETAKRLYLEGIRDGNAEEAVNKYTGARYTQHSTGVKDGKEGFLEFFGPFIERNKDRHIDIVRGWEDDRYAFVQAYQSLNNGAAEWVTTDFFDFDEDGKIVEHWDVISPYNASNPSGHSSVDGATEITDLDKTDENIQLVKDFLKDILFRDGDTSKFDDYIGETYIQHNKSVPDGPAIFKELVNAEDRPLWYEELVLCVGKGNFVAALCKAKWEEDYYCQADIFRIEDGKIVEHWDNVEKVDPNDTANGGKF